MADAHSFAEFVRANEHRGIAFFRDLCDDRGRNLLHCAVINGASDLVSDLVTRFQIDVDALDSDGRAALFYAVSDGNAESVAALLSQSASVSLRISERVFGVPIAKCFRCSTPSYARIARPTRPK